jgi:signal recognition particle GTPase
VWKLSTRLTPPLLAVRRHKRPTISGGVVEGISQPVLATTFSHALNGGTKIDEKEITRLIAIVDSMTPRERANHMIINGARRRRIAKGSGTSVQEVNNLLKQYSQARKMMKSFTGGGFLGKRLAKMKLPMGFGR